MDTLARYICESKFHSESKFSARNFSSFFKLKFSTQNFWAEIPSWNFLSRNFQLGKWAEIPSWNIFESKISAWKRSWNSELKIFWVEIFSLEKELKFQAEIPSWNCGESKIFITVSPYKIDRIDHLCVPAMTKQMILSTNGSNMSLCGCIGLQHIQKISFLGPKLGPQAMIRTIFENPFEVPLLPCEMVQVPYLCYFFSDQDEIRCVKAL